MGHRVEGLATKPANPNSIPETTQRKEKRLHKVVHTLSLNKLKDLLFKTHSAKSVPLREFEGRPPTRKKIFPKTVDQGQPQTETKAAKQNNASETAEKTWRVPEHRRRSCQNKAVQREDMQKEKYAFQKLPQAIRGVQRRTTSTHQKGEIPRRCRLRAVQAQEPWPELLEAGQFLKMCLCVLVCGGQRPAGDSSLPPPCGSRGLN